MNESELINKWRFALDACSHIPTWTEQASLAYCAEVASHAKFMVELGTYLGTTAKVMLVANPHLHLWCVDIFTAFAFNREVAAYFLREEIHQGRCELISGDSIKGSGMLMHMNGKLDAVWVDDGHLEEDVKRDIRSFLPLLRPGGTIFGHDFDIPYNNVALGVIASLPPNSWTYPVPRVWNYVKP